jgi:N-acetylmuramoyl-L-alanine amidase
VVRSGETLSAVARRYGVSVKALMSANDMSSSRLKAGQKLRIPA